MLLLSQWYPPEPVEQPAWIARALVEAGHEVRVLTGMPHYPSGRLQAGYRWWRGRQETHDGIEVLRRPELPYHGPRAIGRVANYGSFAAGSSVASAHWLAWADVVLVYGSPITAATAALLRGRRGPPYVLMVQDVWPDSIVDSGFLGGAGQGRLFAAVDHYVRLTYRRAAEIVVTSPGMVGLLVDRGVPPARLHLVHNWVPDPDIGEPAATDLRQELGTRPGDVVLLYAGNHGPAQGLDVVLRAMTAAPDNLHLVLVGDGVAKTDLVALAGELQLRRTHFWEPRDAQAVARLRPQADAALVSLRDAPLFRITTPSKLQAALAAGQPVVAVCGGDVAEIVGAARAGLVADPRDPGSVGVALSALALSTAEQRAEWGAGAREHYRAQMASRVGAERLSQVLREAAWGL